MRHAFPAAALAVITSGLICASPALAKTMKAPLPAKLFQAKSIYIDNETGDVNDLDKAYTALKEWNRYDIVSDKEKGRSCTRPKGFNRRPRFLHNGKRRSLRPGERIHYEPGTVVHEPFRP